MYPKSHLFLMFIALVRASVLTMLSSRLIRVLTKQQYPDEILPPSWYEDLPTTAPTLAQSLLWDVVVSTFSRATSLQGQFSPEFSWQEYIRSLLQAWIDIAGDKTLQADHM